MNFDQKAKDWDKDPQKVERAELFADEIIRYPGIKKLRKALEFGSGTGLVSFRFKDHFRDITLADTSEGMVEVLKEKIKKEKISNMNPLLLDILSDPSGLADFDIVYTLLVLHHIKDLNRSFEVFNKILKPGGYLCIGDLINEDGSFHQSNPDFDGHRGFDHNELKMLLKKHGFQTEYESIFTSIERQQDQELKKYPLFLLILRKV